jgi:hypothetical protein
MDTVRDDITVIETQKRTDSTKRVQQLEIQIKELASKCQNLEDENLKLVGLIEASTREVTGSWGGCPPGVEAPSGESSKRSSKRGESAKVAVALDYRRTLLLKSQNTQYVRHIKALQETSAEREHALSHGLNEIMSAKDLIADCIQMVIFIISFYAFN